MANTSVGGAKAPLGVGALVSSTFSILSSRLMTVLVLGVGTSFLGILVTGLFVGFRTALGLPDPNFDPLAGTGAGFVIGIVASSAVNLVIYGLLTALLVQVAYDAKLGRSNSLGTYVQSALPAVLPIAVLSLVVAILAGIGMIALIIGGLWVYAVFSVMAPAAVIERTGFGSLGRSAALTKEYRWPIIGLFIVIFALVFILSFLTAFVAGFISSFIAGGFGLVIMTIITAMLNGLGYAIGGIAVAVLYARLREIKEGVEVDQIASVFD